MEKRTTIKRKQSIMNIKTATKKELRQADIDAVQRKAKKEFNQVKMEIYKNILKDLDSCM